MIPVQYRDPQTEEILERRYEEGAPGHSGTWVRIGFDEYRVLYRWRCVPTSCIVYVHRVVREVRRGGQACGLRGPSVLSDLGRGLLE